MTDFSLSLSHTHTQAHTHTHMGSNLAGDEDYINMEISSSSPQIKDFEFQYLSASTAKDSAAAADLFYKGQLLPLHLPPRRQMAEHLQGTTAAAASDQHFRHPPPFLTISTAPCTNSNTPSDSRNISPSESCRASCDLNPNDKTLFEISSFFNNHQPRNNHSWSKKLKMKLMKRSFLAQNKLKSSRAYLKSFFTKSHAENSRISKKFATLIRKNGIGDHRRSFLGAISADSTTNCSFSSSSSSSASSSFNSRALHELQYLRRRSSDAEIEVSIDAAIDHCKKSMQNLGIHQL